MTRDTKTRWHLVRALIVSVFVLVLALSMAYAQTTADIVGSVVDNSGGVMPNAKVTAKNIETNLTRTVETDSAGQFAVSRLPIGTYSVSVEVKGFKTFTSPRVILATNDRARVDAVMAVGEVTETVEVAAQAALVQTDSSTVGNLITAQAVSDLPMNGRNFVELVQLSPGANNSIQGSGASGLRVDDRRQTDAIAANGQMDSANNFLLDGMDNNDHVIQTIIVKPSIDALEEVKVDTSAFTADVGRAGGAVVNMVTKAGTNSLHGSLFEFLRNDVLNAKNYFNVPQAGNPVAGKQTEYRQNQFGGSLGGAIRKDRAFFFVDYEGFRKIQGQTNPATIPTACQLGRAACNGVQQIGNFSDISTVVYDPITHVPYPNNIMPATSVVAPGAAYAQFFPTLSTGCGATCSYTNIANLKQFAHTGDVRIDQHIHDKDTLFVRYSINQTDTFSPSMLPPETVNGHLFQGTSPLQFSSYFPSNTDQRAQSLALSYVHIFSSALLVQVSAQASRYRGLSNNLDADVKGNEILGGPGNVYSPTYGGTTGLALEQFQGGGYVNLGDGFAMPTLNADTNYQYAASAYWTKGNHAVKFGGSFLRRNWTSFQVLFKANMYFSTVTTNSTGTSTGSGGNSFASELTGYYNQFTRNMKLVSPDYRTWEDGLYVMDNWRVSHRLTLNLGLRWDYVAPTTAKRNDISDFDPTDPTTLAGGKVLVAGANGVSNSVNFPAKKNQFQPRTGFALTVARGTVLRGGFGISIWPAGVYSPAALTNAPFVSTATIFQTATPTLNLTGNLPVIQPNSTCLVAACGAPAGSNFTIGTGYQYSDYHNSWIYMYNLVLEKQLGANVVSAGFVGNASRHLPLQWSNADTSLPSLGPGGCGQTTTVSFPSPCQVYYSSIPYVSSLQLVENVGVGNYNAFQAVFQRRMTSGLTVNGSYTYGKSNSNSGTGGSGCTGCGYVVGFPGYDYGPSEFQTKHRAVAMVNYQLPFGKGLRGFAGHVGKGWATNVIYSWMSGQPFPVLQSPAQENAEGITTDRPNIVAGGSFTKSIHEWFNISQFQKQSFGFAGNEGRDMFQGPPNRQLNFSLFKDFPLLEKVRMQFRAEVFNVSNTPNFGLPGYTISSYGSNGTPTNAGNFGNITSMNVGYTPRVIQFALKILF